MKFTESKLEETFIHLLEQEGYKHIVGASLPRKVLDEVLIEDDLRWFLLSQYASDGLTENEANSIILQLKSLPSSDLYESNKRFMQMLSDGFILKREDRSQKDVYIQLIDYSELEKQMPPEPDMAISIFAEKEEKYSSDKNIYRF
ncbi:MAG: type I restriction endonuclease, partial [Erysipelotrichales bacterium]|nr:type I restriction endonuclease [Erysipelotrichales bacterium]